MAEYKRDKQGKITHFIHDNRDKKPEFYPVDAPDNPVDLLVEDVSVGGMNKAAFDRARKAAQDRRDGG